MSESETKFESWEYLADLGYRDLEKHIRLVDIPRPDRPAKRKALAEAFVAKHGRSNKASLKRLACLLLPDCPIPVLAKAVRSTDWKERLAIACHPRTPLAIRKQLARDGNRLVSAAASTTL
jgi:hypothetical protein